MPRVAVLSLVLLGATVGPMWPAVGHADTPAISAADKKRAAARFRDGENAFKKHDYTGAAAAFEEANQIAPHPAALFNAARALEKAGELARAANLCARYLKDAPEKDKRRTSANAMLAELRPKLGRIAVGGGGQDVAIDGVVVELDETHVDPGDHVVTASFAGRVVERTVTVVAGSLERITLEAPKPVSAMDSTQAEPEPDFVRDDPQKEAETKPLSPTYFWVGAGATAVLAGVTVWSGLDTNSAREQFDESPSQSGLDDGRSKQTRTNVLLGATAVVGTLTAVTGLFFTDFSPKRKPESISLAIGPGEVRVLGQF